MLEETRLGAEYKSCKGFKTQDGLRRPDGSGQKNRSSKSVNVRRSTGTK